MTRSPRGADVASVLIPMPAGRSGIHPGNWLRFDFFFRRAGNVFWKREGESARARERAWLGTIHNEESLRLAFDAFNGFRAAPCVSFCQFFLCRTRRARGWLERESAQRDRGAENRFFFHFYGSTFQREECFLDRFFKVDIINVIRGRCFFYWNRRTSLMMLLLLC